MTVTAALPISRVPPTVHRMTVKLVVLYTHPDDADAFDRHYLDVHMPLVGKIPGLQRAEAGQIVAALDGGEETFYRAAELYFADQEALQRDSAQPRARHRGRLPEDRPARIKDVRRNPRRLTPRTSRLASLAVHLGLVRTEGVLQFAEHLDMTGSQSPEGVGRAVAALADDPDLLALTGRALTVDASPPATASTCRPDPGWPERPHARSSSRGRFA